MHPALIALDWGSSSFRAYLMAREGAILDEIATQDGISTVALGAYPGQVAPPDRESLAVVGRTLTEHLELVSRALQAIRAPRYRPSRSGAAPKLERWP